MGFIKSQQSFDLSELNIESIFITDFMPVASGTFVKVYLLGYMYAKKGEMTNRFDNRSLASALQLPLQDVIDAWDYWEKQGIIIKHYHENENTFDVEFLSLRSLYIENNFISKHTKATPKKRERNHPFDQDQIVFQKLITDIEKIIGHPLRLYEYRELNDYFENYYQNTEILLKAFDYNYNTRKITNFKAIKPLLNEWLDKQLMDLDAIEAHITSQDKRYGVYKEVLKLLGLNYRMANEAEKELIDSWIDGLQLTPESLYDFIKYFSKKTLNINFNYLDKSLQSLTAQGIKTIEQLDAQSDKKTTANAPAQDSKKKAIPKRNQFTMEKDRTYTEDELEAMLLNKK